jgi:hypothetical protein
MIKVGQYVRAILAEGIATALPEVEGLEALLDREGVVVEVRPDRGTLTLEDFSDHEHVCHLNGATVVDPATLDSFLHHWATLRGSELEKASP